MCICRVHMQCPLATPSVSAVIRLVNAPPALRIDAVGPDPPSGPPAPARRRHGPGPPPARSSSNPESSEQLPSIAPRWPHSESRGPECATTWPAVLRRVALRSTIVGVAYRADGCLPSGERARSESVSASCALVAWALSMVLIDLPFSSWTHVTFKQFLGSRAAGGPEELRDSEWTYASTRCQGAKVGMRRRRCQGGHA